MAWSDFLLAYSGAVMCSIVLLKRLFRGRWLRLARTTLFVTLSFFLVNYIAEDRRFWEFSEDTGPLVLGIPLSNGLFTALTVPLLLLLHRISQEVVRLYTSRRRRRAH